MSSLPEIPRLEGTEIYLRPVVPEDYPHLQALEMSGEDSPLWRYRGATLSPDRWAQAFWQSVLAQMLVVSRDDHAPIGLVVLYRPELQDGHAYFAAFNFMGDTASPLFLLGSAMFLRYAFACWPLRKIYMETEEFNYRQFSSGEGRWFRVEGRLKEHTYLAGRYWDRLILAIDREETSSLLETYANMASSEPVTVTVRPMTGHLS